MLHLLVHASVASGVRVRLDEHLSILGPHDLAPIAGVLREELALFSQPSLLLLGSFLRRVDVTESSMIREGQSHVIRSVLTQREATVEAELVESATNCPPLRLNSFKSASDIH